MTSILKSIYPELINILLAKFSFISDSDCPGYKSVMERDSNDLGISLVSGTHKSSLLLVGSMMEGLLYCFLKKHYWWINYCYRERNETDFSLSTNESLPYYMSVFNKYFGSFDLDYLPDYVVGYRDIIHQNNEINCGTISVSQNTVKEAVRFLSRIIIDFEQFY